jgi:hypothetical protein
MGLDGELAVADIAHPMPPEVVGDTTVKGIHGSKLPHPHLVAERETVKKEEWESVLFSLIDIVEGNAVDKCLHG